MNESPPLLRHIRIGPLRLPLSTAFPLFVSLPTTLIVSGISTARALGGEVVIHEPGRWIATWMTAYAISWSTVFPVLLVIIPQVERLIAGLADRSTQVPADGADPTSNLPQSD